MKIFKYLVLSMFFGGITLFVIGILSGANIVDVIESYYSDDLYEQVDTVVIEDVVVGIDINVETRNVIVEASDNLEITVDYYEKENDVWTIEVVNDILVIKQSKESPLSYWWDFGITSRGIKDVVVVVPFQYFTDLDIHASTGDIEVNDLSFNTIEVDTDTGNIALNDVLSNVLTAVTDTGNIEIRTSEIFAETIVLTDTGNISVEDLSTDILRAEVDTGDIHIENIEANKISVDSEIGNIWISDIDLLERTIKVNSTFISNVYINNELVSDTYQVIYDDEDTFYLHIVTETGSVYITSE